MPHRWRPAAEPDASQLAKPYLLYKGKCIGKARPGLICQRAHAHEREIVACPNHPAKPFMAATAKAARVLLRESGHGHWALWQPADLGLELARRVARLACPTATQHHCPCGRWKQHQCSLVRLDAAQYFKDADLGRALKALRTLVREAAARGYNAVSLQRRPGSTGRLAKVATEGRLPRSIVTLSDIQRGFQAARLDTSMLVGNLVVQREAGWPMGGSHSEPATLIDSAAFVRRLLEDPSELERVGLAWQGLPADRILAGLQHVDDVLLTSQIWCPDCLVEGLRRLFPPDLCSEEEERGPVLRFLHVVVAACGAQVTVVPFTPNWLFSMGLSPLPATSRCARFLSPAATPRRLLGNFLAPHLHAFARLRPDDHEDLKPAAAALLLEALRSDWPRREVAAVLLRLPRRHQSPFWDWVRQVGVQLRKRDLGDPLAALAAAHEPYAL